MTQERKGSSDCVSSSQLPPWETVVYSLSKSGKQTVHQNQNADGGGRYSMGMWSPNPSPPGGAQPLGHANYSAFWLASSTHRKT